MSILICSECSKMVSNYSSLLEHIKYYHPDSYTSFNIEQPKMFQQGKKTKCIEFLSQYKTQMGGNTSNGINIEDSETLEPKRKKQCKESLSLNNDVVFKKNCDTQLSDDAKNSNKIKELGRRKKADFLNEISDDSNDSLEPKKKKQCKEITSLYKNDVVMKNNCDTQLKDETNGNKIKTHENEIQELLTRYKSINAVDTKIADPDVSYQVVTNNTFSALKKLEEIVKKNSLKSFYTANTYV